MAHSIRIEDDGLYEDIAVYCRENGLGIGKFCERLIREGFSMERYGDFPYGEIRKPSPRTENRTEENFPEPEGSVPDTPAIEPNDGILEPNGVKADVPEKRKPRKRVL